VDYSFELGVETGKRLRSHRTEDCILKMLYENWDAGYFEFCTDESGAFPDTADDYVIQMVICHRILFEPMLAEEEKLLVNFVRGLGHKAAKQKRTPLATDQIEEQLTEQAARDMQMKEQIWEQVAQDVKEPQDPNLGCTKGKKKPERRSGKKLVGVWFPRHIYQNIMDEQGEADSPQEDKIMKWHGEDGVLVSPTRVQGIGLPQGCFQMFEEKC
jgi:hypothetical protein